VSQFSFRADRVGGGRVELDGVDISHAVSGLTYIAASNDIGRLELRVPIIKGEITAEEVVVHIPSETREFLISLGWAPPAAQSDAS